MRPPGNLNPLRIDDLSEESYLASITLGHRDRDGFFVHIKTDVFAKLFHDLPPQLRLTRLWLNKPQA